ncbi:putative membrane protein [Bacillus phage SP-15]|uniref:Putative membrane protein n=1 Tax=Bacillus phage SP-15 TaxID=1792032 RepID=A0A127AWG2_9CAUD|nr:hypothetical protein SP15_250A [Bacillus phage SP-15]AMM45056.1 putative membrane protein [Bacillus phage SP-15]
MGLSWSWLLTIVVASFFLALLQHLMED